MLQTPAAAENANDGFVFPSKNSRRHVEWKPPHRGKRLLNIVTLNTVQPLEGEGRRAVSGVRTAVRGVTGRPPPGSAVDGPPRGCGSASAPSLAHCWQYSPATPCETLAPSCQAETNRNSVTVEKTKNSSYIFKFLIIYFCDF